MSGRNVTNTNVVPVATTVAPYYDDYNEASGFYRLLFRPGYAVQARELTQLQTLAQVQTERLGRFIFQNGSMVSGGHLSYNYATALNLASQYANTDIDVSQFVGKMIANSGGSTIVRAQVIAAANATNSAPPTLMIKYLTGDEFVAGQTLYVNNTSIFANVVSTSNTSANGLTASIADGIFFVNGFFVRNGRQTIIVSKYDPSPNVRVGIEYTDAIVDEGEDTTLLDPAQEASNFQAPGAHRYQMTLNLSTRNLSSTDDSQFIELSRLASGVQQKQVTTPLLSDLEDTLARRTFDESGSYTVQAFKLKLSEDSSNTQNLIARLDPGKAYVFGYIYQTIAPENISFQRPRDTETISNYDISTAYGGYLNTTNHKGFIDISTMPMANLHCVTWDSINNANTTTFNSTRVGSARVRNITFDSTSNAANGLLTNTRTYIFDTRYVSLSNIATAATANTITFNYPDFSGVSNAYYGCSIVITSGNSVGDTRTIVSYNGVSKTATVSSNFTTTPTNSGFTIAFEAADIESLTVGPPAGTLTANVNVAQLSKDNFQATGNTVIQESLYSKLIFPFPYTYIKANTTVNNYQYRKVFSSRTFTNGVGTITAGTGEQLIGSGALSNSIKLLNYMAIVQTGTANLQTGQIISFDSSRGASITVAGSTATMDSGRPGDTFTADVIADILINSGTETNPKIKTLTSANTTHITSSVSNGSFISAAGANATVYLQAGQVHITSPNKTPNQSDSLYIADIKRLQKIVDLNGTAISGGTALSGFTDVTIRYNFNNGQNDNFYDHGSITLKPGYIAPKGPLVVCVDWYSHDAGSSDGKGFLNVDSYPNINTPQGYSNVTYYTDGTGKEYRLSDVIDFRPIRANASDTTPGFTLSGIRIPTPNEEFTVTFDHYLARKDILVLSKNREFNYIKGVSSINPFPPNDPDDAMVLYRLSLPPYVLDTANIWVTYVENKRYTMRDIGALDQRITNLEYYNTLNTLETQATGISITDSNGIDRTKYGIITDAFSGHSVGDITNLDYRCSIDFDNGELRPFFKLTSHNLKFVTGSGYTINGTTLTLSYTEEDFVVQNTATTAVNVEPYLIANYIGELTLIPDGDNWVDTNQLPDVTVNLSGSNDAWTSLAKALNQDVFGTEWNNWQTTWTGVKHTVTQVTSVLHSVPDMSGVKYPVGTLRQTVTTIDATQKTGTATRTGTQTQISFDRIQQSLGNKVVNVSVVPYIRAKEVFFSCSHLRPTRSIYFFFDDQSVLNYIQRPNLVYLTNAQQFIDADGYNERISFGSNTAQVLASRIGPDGNTILRIANTIGWFEPGRTITGGTSGNTAVVADYRHHSGNAKGGTTSTINLNFGASNTANYYVGNTIYLVSGTGLGQNSVIQTYNAVTAVATVSPAFNVAPTTNTKYSIGSHKTLIDGHYSGTFMIPSNDTLKFRTGQKVFRITDDSGNDIDNNTTRADATYTAQGLIQTQVNQSISTTVPKIKVQTLTQSKPVTSSVTKKTTTTTWRDPVAETFIVGELEYPDGIFITSVDLFFKSKDNDLPVSIEIRPTVNGYPDSLTALPFSNVTRYPKDVKTSDNPNAANTATYTTFTFSNPIYLAPATEYALIVMTNSLNYEIYISEMGKKQIGTDRIVSEQPYLGSFFESQNSSTWTPFQEKDLMFRMKKALFSTTPAIVYFNNEIPASNASMDVMDVSTNTLLVANTSVNYAYKATTASGLAVDSTFTNFITDSNYLHSRRKIITNISPSFNLQATLATTTADLSPVLDLTRYNVIAIENWVNNANLSNTNIVLTNDGTGYTATNVSIAIANGSEQITANAYVAAVSGGNITSIIVDQAGSYYTGRANITFTGGGASVNATGVISSELDPSGGPALSKYITRKVVLNDGFNAGDLRVFLTAYKPLGTDIRVYYKIRNSGDPDTFANKNYVLMTQISPPTTQFSKNLSDELEFVYKASANADFITYTSANTIFTTFNEFAIKVVPLADDTVLVPVIKNFRAIRLPGSSPS